MAQIKVETTVGRQYQSESDVVDVSGKETKDITLKKEIEDVEEMLWAIDANKHEVIGELWKEVSNQDEFKEFGYRSPYPNGDIEITASYNMSWHDLVGEIAQVEDIEDKAGIYLDLRTHGRTPEAGPNDPIFKDFLEYIGEKGINTNYWVHGKKDGKDRRDYL